MLAFFQSMPEVKLTPKLLRNNLQHIIPPEQIHDLINRLWYSGKILRHYLGKKGRTKYIYAYSIMPPNKQATKAINEEKYEEIKITYSQNHLPARLSENYSNELISVTNIEPNNEYTDLSHTAFAG